MTDNEEYEQLTDAEPGAVLLDDLGDTKTSGEGDGFGGLPEMVEILTEEQNSGFTTYDIISRTLHQLARDGDGDMLATAISRLGDQRHRWINQLDGDELSPLHYASRYCNPAAITALLQAGALVNVRGLDGLTPLHCAARYRKSIKVGRKFRASRSPDNRSIRSPEPEDQKNQQEVEPPDGDQQGQTEQLEENEQTEQTEQTEIEDRNQLTVTSLGSLDLTFGDGGRYGKPGENSVIQLLVKNSADLNARDRYNLTPLHYACMRGNDVAIRDLLSYPQVDIEARDAQLMTPLFMAATFGYPVGARLMLLASASIIAKDEELQTPLHKAASEGHLEIVQLLLGAAHNQGGHQLVERLLADKDHEKMTPLHFAVTSGHLEISKRLLKAGADPNAVRDTLATPLHAAATAGAASIIILLLAHGGRVGAVDAYQQTALHRAAANDQPEAINTLLDHGAGIDRRDKDAFSPLLVAVSEGHTVATEALLNRGADVEVLDKDDKSVVFWSAAEGNVRTLKILLKDPRCVELVDMSDRYDNSPLHEAARRGYVKAVVALLDAGSLIDNKNEDEETALHIAAEEGKNRVVQELIKRYRFLLNDENEDSDTPLHLASLKGHADVMRSLLEAGADVEARNTSLWTPLDCASSEGHVACCLLLFEYNSPLDPLDKSRTTPLQLAGRGGHVEAVALLLERGASLAARNASGWNALELAIAAGKKDVVMAMVKSPQCHDALRTSRVTAAGKRTTPFRMLITKAPEAAEYVLDRCTTANIVDSDNVNFGIKFNFEFIDDTYQLTAEDCDSKSVSSSQNLKSAYTEAGELTEGAMPYTWDMRELKSNHPLMLMVKHRRSNLLGHPVAVALVKHKWNSSGRFLYYFNLFFFMVFLSFLTGYVLSAPDWAWAESQLNTTSVMTGIKFNKGRDTCKAVEDELGLEAGFFVSAGKWVILVMALLNMIRELFQLYQARLHYLGVENLMEWVCYVCAVLLVWDFSPCLIREEWQWQVGAVAVFLAWIDLLLFIRKFPFFGIYVVMFTDVFATFSKFFIVFFMFIIAFALGFFTILKTHPSFSTPGSALMKTSIMMIGEFEFDSIFNDPDYPLPYPGVTYPLFVAFMILMSILIMNLLVGLAVDDIKAVQEQAVLKRLGMQTRLVLDVEMLMPDFMRRLTSRPYKVVYPNAPRSRLRKVFGDFHILQSFQFLSASEEMSETERLSQSVAELTSQVELLHAQNNKTHALLTALLTFIRTNRDNEGDEAEINGMMRQLSS